MDKTKERMKQPAKKKPEKEKKLTPKERAFCHQWIIDYNASRAARDAGYSEKTSAEIGYENLKKPHIVQYIDTIKEDLEKESGITKLRQLNTLAKIAYSDTAAENYRISAATEINKMQGYHEPEKRTNTNTNIEATPTKDEAKKISDDLENDC